MERSIKLTKEYDASIEDVWAALTSKEALSEWLMPCNFEPIIGYEFEFRTKPYPGFDGVTKCKVLELKDQEVLSFSWSGGSLKESKVTFRIQALPNNRTSLDFEHTGFVGFVNGFIVRGILSNGWKKKILAEFLPKYLSK